MKKLEQITAKNYVSYKEASLRLRPGFTVIHGLNLDRPEKNSSNAAGKSLIVGLLPDMRFGMPPMPMKSKVSWKENFKKDTVQGITLFDEHGKKYDIVKSATKVEVITNGKNESYRKKTDAEEILAKLLPLNEEQFYSLAYLDTKRPPVLQYGTDAQRHTFIEKLYKLDIYNQLGELVKKDWEKTQRLIQDIEVLDRQLSEKSHGIKGDPAKLKQQHKKLMRKTEKIRQRVSDLLASRQECNTFITLAEDLDLTLSVEMLSSKVKELRKAKQAIEDEKEAAISSNKKHEAFASIQERRKRLEEELAQYADVKVDKTIQDRIKDDREQLDRIDTVYYENKRIEKDIQKLSEEREEIEGFSSSLKEKLKIQAESYGAEKLIKQVTKEKVLLRELRNNLTETEEHFSNHDDQNCPICATALDKETMKFIVEKKKKAIDAIQLKIKSLEQMVEHVENKERVSALDIEIKELKKKIITDVEDGEIVKERMVKNEALLSKMRKKVMCKGKLKELPEMEDSELVDLEPLDEKANKLSKSLDKYAKLLNTRSSLDKLNLPFKSVKEAKGKKSVIDESLHEYQPLLDKIQEKLNRVSVDATRAETLSEEVSKLSKSISDLKIEAADHKIKTALRKAFGPRGIRKQRVAEIGTALEATFNDYADQIFDFPIKFELVISDTKFQILAHRNGGVSDVRKLSGAESRYFSLLTMISLLKFCPPEMRLDTVILDEIEANLDIPFKRRYVDVCLPKILEIVPKVVVVTPQSEKEMFLPKAHVYKVIKKNNVSKLELVRSAR